jgi:hypothetical protein
MDKAVEFGYSWKSMHCDAQVTYAIYSNIDGLQLIATV